MSADAAAPRAFERQATGLVREAGWWDVLVYNLNFISIGLMAAFLFNTTIPFYPGVNVYVNELIAFGLVIPLSFVFAMFASAPRLLRGPHFASSIAFCTSITSSAASMPPTPASIFLMKPSCPGTSTILTSRPLGSVSQAKPRSIVMPRSFSSASRSGSMPVNAFTSVDLP